LFKKLELNKIRKFKVIKSKTATFIPDVKSNNKRISIQTNIDNLFVIGDWVNTGLPSTIESAVKSAKELSNYFGKIK
jgi:hypothetical protein